MSKHFGKQCKKCSVNLIGRDSGGLCLKKKKKKSGWVTYGHGGLIGGYNIEISNRKKVLGTYH